MENVEQRIKQIQSEINDLCKQRDSMNNLIIKLNNELSNLSDKRLKIKHNNSISLSDMLEVYIDGRESSFMYKKFHDYFKNNKGLTAGGTYYPSTNQRTINICIKPKFNDKDLKDISSKIVKEILPALKPVKDDDQEKESKRLGIFEHTLAEFGIYSIETNDDKLFKIVKQTYGTKREELQPSSLIDVLKYVRKNLWYQ